MTDRHIARPEYAARARPGPPSPMALRPQTRVAAAGLGALALAAAFPPWDLWFLAPSGPAGLIVAVRAAPIRAAAGYGAGFGLVFFGVLLFWMTNLGPAPWLALVAMQASFFALLGIGVRVLWDRPWRLPAVAGAWVAVEGLRGRVPLGGFPWGRLGFSQADSPAAGWVSVGGIPLLGFGVAAVGAALAALALAFAPPVPRPRRSAAALRTVGRTQGAMLVLTASVYLAGGPASAAAEVALRGGGSALGPGATARIAVVQGNVPRSRESFTGTRRKLVVTANHVAATRELAGQIAAGRQVAPDLVVWPESSSDIDPSSDVRVRTMIAGAVAAIDRPVLIGALLDADGGRRARNVGQLWVPDGRGGAEPVAQYAKRHLVPFGEYIPLRSLLGELGDLTRVSRDFVPGTGPQVIASGRLRIGDVICYEVAYDGAATDAVRAGANLLAVQSNNASYLRDGQLGETLQQLAMTRLRAIEHDRAVAVATTSGISALIAPDGTVLARTATWRAQTLVGELPLQSGRTLASRVGGWPEAAIVAGGVLLPFLRGRPGRRRSTGEQVGAAADAGDYPSFPKQTAREDA